MDRQLVQMKKGLDRNRVEHPPSPPTSTGCGVLCHVGAKGGMGGRGVMLYSCEDGKVVQHCTRSGCGLDIQVAIKRANTMASKSQFVLVEREQIKLLLLIRLGPVCQVSFFAILST